MKIGILLIFFIGLFFISSGVTETLAQEWSDYNTHDPGISTTHAIPDWVKNQFEWYLKGDINEETLLTSMNWMFDNNIMHLSQKAAQTVQQLREENQRYKDLLDHELTHSIQQDNDSPNDSSSTSSFDKGNITKSGESTETENIVNDFKIIDDTVAGYSTKVLLLTGKDSSLSDEDKMKLLETALEIDSKIITLIESLTNQNPELFDSDSLSRIKVKFPWMRTNSSSHNFDMTLQVDLEKTSKTIEQLIYNNISNEIDWKNTIDQIAFNQGINTADSVVDDLQGIVILCSVPIEKELQVISTELEYINDWLNIISQNSNSRLNNSIERSGGERVENTTQMDFMDEKLAKIESKIISIQTGLRILDDHTQDYNLKNKLDGLQSTLNILKAQHDIAMKSIQNMRA